MPLLQDLKNKFGRITEEVKTKFTPQTDPLKDFLNRFTGLTTPIVQDFQARIPRFQQRVIEPVTNYAKDVASFAGFGQTPPTAEGLKRRQRFAQTPIAQMTPEDLALSFGPTAMARVKPLKVKLPKPTVQEIADYERQALSEIQAEVQSIQRADPNQQLFTKMRNFLKFAGEKTSKDTGLLFKEHIPRKVFGESSDELATSMGISENQLMSNLTEGITTGGEVIRRISPMRIVKRAKTLYEKLDPQSFRVIRDIFGKVQQVSVEPSPKTLAQIAKKQFQAQERAAKSDYLDWQKQVFQQEKVQTIGGAVKQAVGAIKTQTRSPLSQNVEQLKDIGNIAKGFRDVYRNFEHVFGKRAADAKRLILDPFDRSKGVFVNELNQLEKSLEENIIKRGIKKGSTESQLVQLYGEKQISLAELKRQSPNKWRDIVEADKWFRQTYDQLLNEVNKVRQAIYPNDPEAIIPKRENYYRHFREIADGVKGLVNIFDTPANIESHLAGTSEFTSPISRFLSFAQRRLGQQTEVDAVGGFIDYARAASYAKNIDPHIGRFRALQQELADATAGGTEQAGKLNNFIEYLHDFANDLAGKTNTIDRAAQKYLPGGRQTFRAISWTNSRVKANVMLGNLSSSLAQIFNVPQGMANVGNPKYWVRGLGDSLADMFIKNKPMGQSTFITERYNRAFEKFNTGLLEQPKKLALWLITALDEVGTKYIWNMHYRQGLDKAIPNPIKYADDITRKMVAGRSIGEVPLAQKAKLSQMVIPFQIEVGNLWWVMKDMVDQRAFGKLTTLFIFNHLFNKAAESIRGSAVTFDPIEAMLASAEVFSNEEDKKIGTLKAGGRLSGEVLSNLPFGQTLAQFYPELGLQIAEQKLPTRKELFGRQDPTRFGGGPLFAKGITDPLYKLIPPFGGGQAQKTIEGIGATTKGYSENQTGRVRFPTEDTALRNAQRALFGQYSTPEAQRYFKEEGRVLGEKQSETFKSLLKTKGKITSQDYFGGIQITRQVQKIDDAIKEKKTPEGEPALIAFRKAEYIFSQVNKLETKEQKTAFVRQLVDSGFLDEATEKRIDLIAKLDKRNLGKTERALVIYDSTTRAVIIRERLSEFKERKNKLQYLRNLEKEGLLDEATYNVLETVSPTP